jgi:hypothetical protein
VRLSSISSSASIRHRASWCPRASANTLPNVRTDPPARCADLLPASAAHCRSRKVLTVNRIGQARLHSCSALGNTLDLIHVARGREVTLCLAAREKLLTDGVAVRVVSMRSSELFEERDAAYQDGVPPSSATARG